MNKLLLSLIIYCLPIFSIAQVNKKVLIIGIDGCRPDALQIANTPNIDNLINNGIYSPDALNNDITISGPGWSAILCGVWSDKHLVTNNDFSGNDYANYPPISKYIEDFSSEMHTVSICHWSPINEFIIQNHIDFKLNVSSDLELSNQAASYISVNDPDFIFLHFDDVDHAGHSYGFSPSVPEYISAIEAVDVLIDPIIQAIEGRSSFPEEDWLILLTTDHGGQGNSHGGNSLEEQRVFFIASGPSVNPAIVYADSTYIIENPINCLGEEIELQFDGIDDFVQIPADPIFNFANDQDFTIECRVRTAESGDVSIIGNKDWNSGLNKGFVFSFKYPSGPEWKVNIGDGSNRADIDSGGEIGDSEWHTLSVSFDRDGMMKMYQDGQFLSETDISFIGDIITNEGLFFGTDINSNYDYTGSIAEVRVWDGIVENQAIMDWHCASIDNTHPNFNSLLAYWKANESSGLIVNDFSSNNNTGDINGAIWNAPDSTLVYDFDATPRLTDIPYTALTHLCIPIQDEWALDGQSWIPECMPTSVNSTINQSIMEAFPNPGNETMHLNLSQLDLSSNSLLDIYDATGKRIHSQSVSSDQIELDISDLPEGIYTVIILSNGDQFIKKIVKTIK